MCALVAAQFAAAGPTGVEPEDATAQLGGVELDELVAEMAVFRHKVFWTWALLSAKYRTHSTASCRPAHAAWRALLRGQAHRMLIGACDPT